MFPCSPLPSLRRFGTNVDFADGEVDIYQLEAASGPLLVVVGSEGRGLSRLVGETCDMLVSIPMSSEVESLNASVAAAVTLAEVSPRRTYN